MSRPSSTGSDRKRPSKRSSKGPSKRRKAPRAASGTRAKSSRPAASGTRAESKTGRVLHLELWSGIAGNMFLAALLDLGLPRKQLESDLAGLGVDFALRVRKVRRGALAARRLDVVVPGASWRGGKASGRGAHGGRSYAEIRRLLERARLDAEVRARALALFEAMGRAEARVHGKTLAKVRFHELGAVDAIVDVTGAAAGLARLGIERVTASPVALGGEGSFESEHGRLPLPAPATLELLRGIPTLPAHVRWETVTPTGAAILRTLVDEFRTLPAMTVEAVGYGAGDDRPGPMPNVLRAVLGRQGGARSDRIVSLETNLDDFVPEHFDHLMERLFEAGALDVSIQHLQMKKNRPGFLLRVLARPAERLSLARILFAESTAIGVRATESDRLILEREQRRVETPFGRIGVKRVWDTDGRLHVSAEYDDCKRAAKRTKAPLRDIIRAAEEAGRELG